MRKFARGWDAKFASELLLHLPVVRETMPPFAGDEHDRAALGGYLASLSPATPAGQTKKSLGNRCSLFIARCATAWEASGGRWT